MKAIIIGAGRGKRLMPYTAEMTKCFMDVGGRRILDWALDAFRGAGLHDHVFIGGYCIEQVRAAYPGFSYRHNDQWERNNILASLFYAEDAMTDGFVCSYADILYRPSVVRKAIEHPGEIVLCVDTCWRARYAERTEHPEDDAEKVRVDGDRVIALNRDIPADDAHGEYIGVARFSAAGAKLLREHHARLRERCGDEGIFRRGKPFRLAYLIELFEVMIDEGVPFHRVETSGEYMEIDTQEDYDLAREKWK